MKKGKIQEPSSHGDMFYYYMFKSSDVYIKPDIQLVISKEEVDLDETPAPAAVIATCQERAKAKLAAIGSSGGNGTATAEATDAILDELTRCLEQGMVEPLLQIDNEVNFHYDLRTQISYELENFTCIDPEMGTSPDIDTREWTSDKDGKTRVVHVKLERPASRIHVVEDFASQDECMAMEEAAKTKLHRASVADGKGGVNFSHHRKAMQAGITPNWDAEADGDLVARLSRRVYDYANHVLDLNLSEEGQEPLMSIQYFGTLNNDLKLRIAYKQEYRTNRSFLL